MNSRDIANEIHKFHIEHLDLGEFGPTIMVGVDHRQNDKNDKNGQNGQNIDANNEKTSLICLTKDANQSDFEPISDASGNVYLVSNLKNDSQESVVIAPTKIVGKLEVWSPVVPDYRSVMNRELTGGAISFFPKKYTLKKP